MTETSHCPECGAKLGEGVSPGGLCPNCLMKLGLSSGAKEREKDESGTEEPREGSGTTARR